MARSMACPDETKISEFVARALPATVAARIEAHLADCDDCRHLVFALASSGDATTPDATDARRIGRFEIVDVVGRGAMGVVYRASDPDLDRTVAIKVRRAHAKLDVDAEDRLRREARALAKLTHPNVVAVYDTGRHDGMAFVAMEYVDGVTLDRWLDGRRDVEQILDVLVGAGRGLAAAHAAGLVHRDFKPHNVFVASEQGIAKVGDFGLVRTDSATEPAAELTLSVSGAIVGTPAYMAPEQLRGEPATELSDQFSFCVTLYEALYGTRPFVGKTLDELATAMQRDVQLPASPHARAAVKRALRRGLSLDPAARFASMTALLAVLTNRTATKRWIAAAAFVTLATMVTAGTLAAGESADPCSTRDAQAERVFSATRMQEIADAFAKTGARGAPDVAARAAKGLTDYGARWQLAATDSCRATARGRQSKQLGDRQRACLERRLQQADELASVLAAVTDDKAIGKAAAAVQSLADIDTCTRADLADREPPPAGKEAEVRQVEGQLDHITGLYKTGQIQPAAAAMPGAIEAARATGYSAVLARALLVQSVILTATDRFAEVEAILDEAAREAAKARDDRLAAEAWTRRVYAVGVHFSRYDDAHTWAKAADAAVLRAGNPPDLRAALQLNISTLLTETDKLAEAAQELLAVLELRTRHLPHDKRALSDVHNNLAALLQRQGKLAEGKQQFEHALELSRSVHGEEHPDVFEMYINLGFLMSEWDKPDQAIAYLEKALALGEKLLGPDHVNVGVALDTMGLARVSLGQYEEAVKLHRRAYDIMLGKLGPTHRRTGFAMGNVARATQRLGDYPAAIEAYQASAKILVDALGADHDIVARIYIGLGNTHRAAGDRAAARRELERALAILDKKESPEAAIARSNLAQMALERGDCKVARKDFELAFAAMAASMGAENPMTLIAQAGLVYCDAVERRVDPERRQAFETVVAAAPIDSFEPQALGFLQYTRARVAAAGGDKPRARELAAAAIAAYDTAKLVGTRQGVEAFVAKELQ
jgi:eukaryotic-like serine/threonine-protein kinase